MIGSSPVRVLAVTRFILGVVILVVPRFAGRLFGLDAQDQPALAFLGRLFAIRNLVLAVGLAKVERLPDARLFLAVNVGVDVADAGAAIASWRRGELSAYTGMSVVGLALFAAALGAAALTATESESAQEHEPAPVSAKGA